VTRSAADGLTVTGLSGTGWSCSLATTELHPLRRARLRDHYPLISPSTSMSLRNAGGVVTNNASVAGGGETKTITTMPATNDDHADMAAHRHGDRLRLGDGADKGAISAATDSGGVCKRHLHRRNLSHAHGTPGRELHLHG
jgi:hypothetical protein